MKPTHCLAWLVLIVHALLGRDTVAFAQEPLEASLSYDRVVLGPGLPRSTNVWNPHLAVSLAGRLEQIDSQTFELVTKEGQRHKLASNRIERIEVAWDSPDAAAAHQRFVHQEYTQALQHNDDVLRAGGIRKWQQCILLAELVESAEALGKVELAGRLFLTLAAQSPPDYLIATIPLNWTSRECSPGLAKQAREWLTNSDEYANLLGASWLLLGDASDLAKQKLLKLQSSQSKLVQRLAAMQLWRATPPSETSANLNRWFADRDSLLLPWQLGPTEFLAERCSRIGKTELAIGEWLRIAANHDDHPARAALALDAAQERLAERQLASQAQMVSEWKDSLIGSKKTRVSK